MASFERRPDYGSWRKRLAWMLLLWLLGVAALGALAGALRLVMSLAGLAD